MLLSILVTSIGVAICAVSLKLGFWYLDSYRLLLRSKCFHGPRSLPFIGIIHRIYASPANILELIQGLINKYPSPFRLWLGPELVFGIHEPDQIRQVLTSPNALEKPPILLFVFTWLGEGLFTGKVPTWKPHRKVIQQLFNTKILDTYLQTFVSKASIAAEKIGMDAQDKELDFNSYISRYTLDTICETTMGVNVNALNDENCIYHEMVDSLLDAMPRRLGRPWLHSDFLFKLSPSGRRYFKCMDYVDRFTKYVLKKAKETLHEKSEFKGSKSMMNLLLRSAENGYKFTDKAICDEVATMITAGYETTTNLLNFASFILANYPDIQDKVYAEVREICGECSSKGFVNISANDLNRMEYLDLVIKETLRFFPAGALLPRCLLDDVKIGEYTLPAGSSLLIDMFEVQRTEKYWPRAAEFIPERFLPKHKLGPRHPYAYIPFSSGARGCIGMKYAMMSTKVFIATFVSRYTIKTKKQIREAKDLELWMNGILKPKNPIMLAVERRLHGTS